MKTLTTSFLVVFLLMNLGCSDAALTKVSQALNDTALAVGGLQSIAIAANKQGTLSDAETQKLLVVCWKVNQAGQQAVAVTRKVSKLDPTSRGNLLNILQPIVTAVADASSSLSVNDPKLLNDIRTALLAIQTGLTTAQLIISGGKP